MKIDDDIPMPEPQRGPTCKYPWYDMRVNQSFWVDGVTQSGISSTASLAGKRMGYKFSVRKDGDGFRVWRTE